MLQRRLYLHCLKAFSEFLLILLLLCDTGHHLLLGFRLDVIFFQFFQHQPGLHIISFLYFSLEDKAGRDEKEKIALRLVLTAEIPDVEEGYHINRERNVSCHILIMLTSQTKFHSPSLFCAWINYLHGLIPHWNWNESADFQLTLMLFTSTVSEHMVTVVTLSKQSAKQIQEWVHITRWATALLSHLFL